MVAACTTRTIMPPGEGREGPRDAMYPTDSMKRAAAEGDDAADASAGPASVLDAAASLDIALVDDTTCVEYIPPHCAPGSIGLPAATNMDRMRKALRTPADAEVCSPGAMEVWGDSGVGAGRDASHEGKPCAASAAAVSEERLRRAPRSVAVLDMNVRAIALPVTMSSSRAHGVDGRGGTPKPSAAASTARTTAAAARELRPS